MCVCVCVCVLYCTVGKRSGVGPHSVIWMAFAMPTNPMFTAEPIVVLAYKLQAPTMGYLQPEALGFPSKPADSLRDGWRHVRV